MVAFALTTVPIGSSSRDPIYNLNLYSYVLGNPVNLNDPEGKDSIHVGGGMDPSGSGACKLASPPAGPVAGGCKIFPYEADGVVINFLGFEFTSDFSFQKPCCCCEFRQYKLGRVIEVVLKDKSTKTIEDEKWNDEEDCDLIINPNTGKQEKQCYGHKDDYQNSSDIYTQNCGYKMKDAPKVRVRFLRQLMNKNNIGPLQVESIKVTWKFRQRIIDVCVGGVVWERDFSKTCTLTAAQVAALR